MQISNEKLINHDQEKKKSWRTEKKKKKPKLELINERTIQGKREKIFFIFYKLKLFMQIAESEMLRS